ncbi:MAG: hypothetical protein E6Q88_11690 [Lysobacteraceae bacterium]|nr:MAG: hypothetical protein E6Q88_11690 [Xanthomonadaceae bacterium]
MVIIYLYEQIESGSAANVISKLRGAGDSDVSVRINSPGGDVAEGIAIYNALKPYAPTVYIDGVAASVASFVAMAGKRIVAAQNALMMIHNPWAHAAGDSAQFRQLADALDKHRDALLSGYSRSGISRSALITLLDAETWLSAEDALSMGFVDEIAEPQRFAAHAPEYFSGYYNTPRELLMPIKNTSRASGATTPSQNPAPNQSPAPNQNPDLSQADPRNTLEAFRVGLGSEPVVQAAYDAVMQNLTERNEQVQGLFAAFRDIPGIQALEARCLADPRMSIDRIQAQILARVPNNAAPLSGGNSVRSDSSDFVRAASDSLLIRAGIRVSNPHPGARDVMGMGLKDIVRACISRGGGSRFGEGDSQQLSFRAAMSTSDFPSILNGTLNKALRGGYEVEPATFAAWTRHVFVPDFKEQQRLLLGSAPGLLKVGEGGEYQNGSIDEDKAVPYKVEKFGRIIQLTWEAIINDDLGAFLRITQAMGQAASRTEADLVYKTFTENSGFGPMMQDGKALFHEDHKNLGAIQGGLTSEALGAARVLLRRQTTPGGGALNLVPRFLLVAPEHEQDAEVLLATAGREVTSGTNNTMVPAWVGKLDLVVEARLAGNAFYLATSPENVDTMERAWLEIDNGPQIDEEDSFRFDSRSYKVRHVCGCRWLDWRGIVMVPVGPT